MAAMTEIFDRSSAYNKKNQNAVESRSSPPIFTVNNNTHAAKRWTPAPITDQNELIFRRIRGILNKLTPEKFDKLTFDLLNIITNKTILKGTIILIFEKAVDEQSYSSLYAQLCKRISHEVPNFDEFSTNINTFMRMLLSRCQDEFETRNKASTAFDKHDRILTAEEANEKVKAKRKMLGNIKFIGELGKLELVQEAILHKCIQQCLAKKKRTSLADMVEDIECLCQIMSTVGKLLDTNKAQNIMNQYFDRVAMLSMSEELPSRIRFMLEDVRDLRKHNWMPRRIERDSGPRSVSQMRWEMMGPMMPPYPYFPSGPQDMMAPFFRKDVDGMPWLNDPMFAGAMIPPHGHTSEFTDDNKDIFGKPVSKTPWSNSNKMQPKTPVKADLFQPHYIKSKKNGESASQSAPPGKSKSKQKDDKVRSNGINKSNPWNIDPFVPHYNKPTAFPVKEEVTNNNTDALQKKASPNLPRGPAMKAPSKQQNGEISLRPSSSLNKKDEKPKTTLKAEELPVKRSQFTNLTINDKTSKSKKSSLNKSDVDKKIVDMMAQYRNDGDWTLLCNEVQSLATNIKYLKMVVKQLFYYAFSKEETDWMLNCTLLLQCKKQLIVSVDTLSNVFFQLFDDTKVMDGNKGKSFVAVGSAVFVINGIIDIELLFEHFHNGRHFPTALICLAHMQKEKGKEWLMDLLKESSIDLKTLFTVEDRSDKNITKETKDRGLTFLFPHLFLKDDMLRLMKQGEGEEQLIDWTKNHLTDKVEKKQLIHVIVSCVVTVATESTLQFTESTCKPEKDCQDKERDVIINLKNLLKAYVTTDAIGQLETLYALQIFCYEKGFPKDMLLRLFIVFYNNELVEEEVFLKWKEDINDAYPGKGKSLFQVNTWLQWLETADEEEDDEEENTA